MVRKKFTRRQIALGLTCALLSVPVLTFYIWHQVEVLRIGYDRQKLQLKARELTKAVERLEAEKAACLSLDKVEKIAKERLGYQIPGEDQVLIIDQKHEERRRP